MADAANRPRIRSEMNLASMSHVSTVSLSSTCSSRSVSRSMEKSVALRIIGANERPMIARAIPMMSGTELPFAKSS